MSTQREMNQKTWERLVGLGFKPGDPLDVDVYFAAVSGGDAGAVESALELRGYEVDISTARVGIIRRRTEWTVGASRRFDAVSLDVLDALVDEMEDLAVDTGTVFDGWGAEIG